MIDADRGDPMPQISLSFWPHYSNPYQDLFYGNDDRRVRTRPETIDEALARFSLGDGATIRCFHVHWLNAVVSKKHRAWQARRSAGRFLRGLREFKCRGGVVIWTIHNLVSHDTPHPRIDAKLGAAVGEIADIVLLHGSSAVQPARRRFHAIAGKELIVSHGNYIGTYRNRLSRTDARTALGLGPAATIFLCLGAVRPYKGLINLIETMGRREDLRAGCRLVVAGRPSGLDEVALRRAAVTAGVSLTCDLREIPADEMEVFLNGADWMVLPYQEVLTSGSAMLAMSFALPVLAPRLGLLPEFINDGVEGLLYQPHAKNGLERGLARALATTVSERCQMADAAFRKANSFDWSTGRQAMLARVRAVHARDCASWNPDGRVAERRSNGRWSRSGWWHALLPGEGRHSSGTRSKG